MTEPEAAPVEEMMLAEARAEVANADHKASLVLAALGIGFAAVFAGLIAGDWQPSRLEGLGEPLWWLGATLSLVSVGCAASAVWPRYIKADVSGGIYYWGHVATFADLPTFVAEMEASVPDPAARVRHQLWRIAKIVDRKYMLVRSALVSSGVAVATLLLASLFGG